ncbi:hypothetical protein Plhal304r1_c023g0080011 [Plasmopara halstedii]
MLDTQGESDTSIQFFIISSATNLSRAVCSTFDSRNGALLLGFASGLRWISCEISRSGGSWAGNSVGNTSLYSFSKISISGCIVFCFGPVEMLKLYTSA